MDSLFSSHISDSYMNIDMDRHLRLDYKFNKRLFDRAARTLSYGEIKINDDKNLSEKQAVFTYQLGFYSSKENAQNLVNRCKEKNISAQIQQVTRPSGNVYFAVIVKSTNSEIGTIIKNSGFECYPIFE